MESKVFVIEMQDGTKYDLSNRKLDNFDTINIFSGTTKYFEIYDYPKKGVVTRVYKSFIKSITYAQEG